MAYQQSGFLAEPEVSPTDIPALEPLAAEGSGVTRLYLSRAGGRARIFKALAEEYRGNMLYENLLRKDFEIGFSLLHPHICEYYSFQNIPGLGNAIEMEHIEGRSLAKLLQDGRPDARKCRKILSEICEALEYMHGKQIYHRDLKPENILITDNGFNVKLIDFGCADSDSHYANKGPAGTLGYASPELEAGLPVDARTDIWSLGLVMKQLSPAYARISARCTRKSPDDRYASAAEVLQALRSHDRTRAITIAAIAFAAAATLIAAAILLTGNLLTGNNADELFYSTGSHIEKLM